uniref:Lipoprotein n=2 Tax=Bursaphelenchus xylophilus TaxID=6326 RepID=A0A1I7SKL6_BURXY
MGPGPQTGSGTSAAGYYFFENFMKGTYYIRKGSVFTEDDEKEKPKSLDPKNYEGPAVFYAYYDSNDKKIHMVDYLKKTVKVIDPLQENGGGFIFAAVEPYVPFKVGELRAKENAEKEAKSRSSP